jgi:hypothetical protein
LNIQLIPIWWKDNALLSHQVYEYCPACQYGNCQAMIALFEEGQYFT